MLWFKNRLEPDPSETRVVPRPEVGTVYVNRDNEDLFARVVEIFGDLVMYNVFSSDRRWKCGRRKVRAVFHFAERYDTERPLYNGDEIVLFIRKKDQEFVD